MANMEEEDFLEQSKNSYNPTRVMMDYLNSKYEFLRDEVKNHVLWRLRKNKKDAMVVLEDNMLYSLSLEMKLEGLKSCNVGNIQEFLGSNYVDSYHPLKDYFNAVKKHRKNGYIAKLAATVSTTSKADLFLKYLTKWLVASVANVMIDVGCHNHTCLTLTGGEGKGKTRWLTHLCPKSLHPKYIFSGELDLNNKKDTIWKLAEYFLINIEEQIKGLYRNDANFVKGLITMDDVKGRKSYGRLEAHGRRIANFVTSTNDDDFLVGGEANRRFLCFKITDISNDFLKLNIDDVWSEAYQLYDSGFDYRFSQEDIKELAEHNKSFTYIPQEQEYVSEFFKVPSTPKDATHLLTSTAIRDYLKAETFNNNLKEGSVGRAMKALGLL